MADDLFEQFDELFKGNIVEVPIHPVVLNRFMASDKNFAVIAKELNLCTWDADLMWSIWLAVLSLMPKRVQKAPRMRYTAAKKASDPTALASRIMETEGVSRDEAELLIAFAGDTDDLLQVHAHYGIQYKPFKDAT